MGTLRPFSASRYAVGATDQVEAYARILSTFRPVWGLSAVFVAVEGGVADRPRLCQH